jgi:hypothetical protein
MILYFKDPKVSTRNLLDLISTFNKVVGLKINQQKTVAFLSVNNKNDEKEIRKTTPFTIVSKRYPVTS